MVGHLATVTIQQDFWGVKDLGLERRRQTKERIQLAVDQVAMQRAIQEANTRLLGRGPPGSPIVMEAEGQEANGQRPAVVPAASGRPTPSQPEDLGITGEGGPAPAPEA